MRVCNGVAGTGLMQRLRCWLQGNGRCALVWGLRSSSEAAVMAPANTQGSTPCCPPPSGLLYYLDPRAHTLAHR